MAVKIRSLLILAAAAGSAFAQESDSQVALSHDGYFEDLPIVLSVSRLAQPLQDAPGSVTVIDAQTIRTSGARDLAELLRMVPGFLVAHSFSGAPIAVYHGMTDENPRGLQILIDGRSQYSPLFFGGVAWNLIDVSLDEIARIEVIRGSNSAAYGSNAFLGVVNIVTFNAAETQGVRVRVAQGNDGIQERGARVGMRVGDASVRLSAETQRDNGVLDYHDGRRNQRVNLRADVPLGMADELQILAGNTQLRLQTGYADTPTNPFREFSASKDFVSFAWTRSAADGSGVSLRYTRTNELYDDAFVARSGALTLPIDYHTSSVRDEAEFQHTLLPTDETRLVWGAGVRYDAVRGQQYYNTRDAVRQDVNRLFGNLEWRPSREWTTNVGLTWEDDSLSDTSLAPRLAVNYHLSPRQTLRAGISRAQRIPSLTESRSQEYFGAFDTARLRLPYGVRPLDIGFDASGDLEKEVVDVQEIGYLGDFHEQGLFLDVRAFREKVSGRIVPVVLSLQPPNCEVLALLTRKCGNYTDFINGQDLVIRGIEYQARWRPRPSTEFTVNQAFTSIDSEASAALFANSRRMAIAVERHMDNSAPEAATMLRWVEQLPSGGVVSLTYYRYGRFQWTRGSAVDAFHRTDLRLAQPFRMGATRGEVSITAQGLDGKHAEFRSRNADRNGATAAAPQYLDPRVWLGFVLEL
ncbi:TonB-dependent siderophore receptor [Azoarcus sp. KH32C]|uniref:TonB-dependent receptor plug domain-containing protein n=1 Tax=Azoarcus sp. KH32C TaxID=748247 RepID=UPI0002386262|nr:TonB-dependent receptor [Azoarcus sp. KH32C]BAL23567.1 putative TonB-dependent receptor [Azoarcus sp. KH32C]